MANDFVDGFDIADAGDNLETAYPLDTNGVVSGSLVDADDQGDWFEIFAGFDGLLVTDLFEFSADLDLHLYSLAGELLASSSNLSAEIESISFNVDEGTTYYLEVVLVDPAGSDYSLKLDVTPDLSGDDDIIDGDNIGDALNSLPGSTVDPNGAATGSIGYLGDVVDGYSFVAQVDGSLSVSLTGLRDDVTIQIFAGQALRQESLILLDSATSEGGDTLRINVNAVAGQSYYVQLGTSGTARTDYVLDLSLIDLADLDDYVDGRKIGDSGDFLVSAETTAVSSFVQGAVKITSDIEDYYRFVAPSRGSFMAVLELDDTETGQIFIDLFDAAGNRLASSVPGDKLYGVESGASYTVRVGAVGVGEEVPQVELAPVRYRLSFVLLPYSGRNDVVDDVITTDAGNNRSTATALTDTSAVFGSTGYADDNEDFFSLVVSKDGQLNVALSGLESDLDLRLLDEQGQLAASTTGGSANESLQFSVVAGEQYFIHIDPFGSAESDYRLDVDLSDAPTGADDIVNGANLNDAGDNIDLASGVQQGDIISGSVGVGSDSADVYRLELMAGTVIGATLGSLSGNLNLFLLSSNGSRLGASERPGLDAEGVSYIVEEDATVFLQVVPAPGTNSIYELVISTFEFDQLLLDGPPLYSSAVREADGDIISGDLARLFRLYLGGLGRTPDEEGMRFYIDSLNEGSRTLSVVAAEFVDSAEFRALADIDGSGVISNDEFLQHMYLNVFNRQPDQGGLNFWLGELTDGQRSQSGVFEEMVNSDEYVTMTAPVVSSWGIWDNLS